jgi:TatD DNase family protein
MIDTHVHLNHSDFADDTPEAILRALQAGVEGLVVVGYDLDSNRDAAALAAAHPQIWASVGLHPHCAASLDEQMLEELRRQTREAKVVAVGETGLDYFRNLSPREEQQRAFRAMLALATELGLPLIVHNREAGEDTLALLAEAEFSAPVIMHCFAGDDAFASECRERDYYIGVGGTVTYPKSEPLRSVLAAYPGKRILLETDAPWLPPQSRRGGRNEPALLAEIAARVAEVRGESVEALDAQTTANARRVFGLEATP